jgi:GNAT superfamily N-acetyltransferase
MNEDVRLAFTIRRARAGDEGHIVALLRELAAFEKLQVEFHLDDKAVARDLFGGTAQCELLLRGGEAVGVAVWFWSYRSFRAVRGVYVEDLYVQPSCRGQGGGRMLLAHLARTARDAKGYMEWRALDWNKPARDFYEGLGAVAQPEWIGYRLQGDALERLCL